MDSKTIKNSIDYFVKNSNREKERVIIIYGGEPLLEKQKVNQIIDYCTGFYKDEKINISLVTNGSLIDENIARYVSEKNLAVSVSLDGPNI